MVGNGSISRRSEQPCWAMFATFSIWAFFFMLLASPISGENGSNRDPSVAQVYSEEGENLTTPATPIRQFVWKVRNWMFHRDDQDVNIEVDAEATAEPTDAENTRESKSWVRSVAAWFARGIRHLLERLNPGENGTADSNWTEESQNQDGTKPQDSGSQDSTTKPTRQVFRPWTALPPPPPPGMTASPDPSSTGTGTGRPTGSSTARTDTDSTPVYSKPPSTIAGKSNSDSEGRKFSTTASKTTGDAATSTSAKKPKRRRPKPLPPTLTISTTSPYPYMPPPAPSATEEVFIQDTGNEI